jgi:predicted dehydrogenase
MEAAAPRLRVGLVGCGYWGINLCRVLAHDPGIELVVICDENAAARERAARLAPTARLVASLDEMLQDGRVEAVAIATPVNSHHRVVMAALRSGRHVLVEKPLSRSVEEGEEMCLEAARRGLVLMVGHVFLYNSAVRRVKAMIDSGELGELRYIFCRRLNLGIVRQDVDVLWDLGSHDVSMLHYWVDRPVERVAAFGHSFLQPGIADVVFGHIAFDGNVAGHLQVSWVDPAKVRQATIVGSRKMVIYDDISADARIAVYDKGIDVETMETSLGGFETFAEHQVKMRAGDVWLPRVEFPEPLSEEVAEWAACIRETRTPLSDGRFGLKVVATMDLLRRAGRGLEAVPGSWQLDPVPAMAGSVRDGDAA